MLADGVGDLVAGVVSGGLFLLLGRVCVRQDFLADAGGGVIVDGVGGSSVLAVRLLDGGNLGGGAVGSTCGGAGLILGPPAGKRGPDAAIDCGGAGLMSLPLGLVAGLAGFLLGLVAGLAGLLLGLVAGLAGVRLVPPGGPPLRNKRGTAIGAGAGYSGRKTGVEAGPESGIQRHDEARKRTGKGEGKGKEKGKGRGRGGKCPVNSTHASGFFLLGSVRSLGPARPGLACLLLQQQPTLSDDPPGPLAAVIGDFGGQAENAGAILVARPEGRLCPTRGAG